MTFSRLVLAAALAAAASAQTVPALNNSSLNGTYFFRHLQFSTDTSGNVIDTRAALGTIIFDGAGHFSLSGFQTVTNFAAVNLAIQGVYSLNAGGVIILTNPQRSSYLMNGRAGAEAIIASTTESGDNTFDLFAAVPVPTTAQSYASFSGTYYFASLEFPGGGGTAVRSALTAVTSGGNGAMSCTITGHSAGVNNGAISTQSVSGLSYAFGSDGSGTANFGSLSNNLNGTKNMYVSQSGNVVIGGSLLSGSQDFLIGIRALSGAPATTSLSGLYWEGGLRLDRAHDSTAAYAGALNGFPALGRVAFADRLHQIGISPGYDFTGENDVVVNAAGSFPNGTLSLELDLAGVGANAATMVDAGLSSYDTGGYSIDFAFQAPAFAGAGVYLNPLGVVNAASLAPAGQSVSPGEFVSLFGSGLAAQQMAASPPYPAALGGVGVTVNGVTAPVYFVNATQVNFLVPYAVSGNTATIVVTSGSTASNAVTVPLQATSPGVFAVDGSGTGDGAVTHASGALVSATNPAKRGETVTIYAAGLGLVTPLPPDGFPGSANPLSAVTVPVTVTIGGQAVTVVYGGLAPGFPGLYQLNVTIPATLSGSGSLPLAIETADTFTDQVNIQIQ